MKLLQNCVIPLHAGLYCVMMYVQTQRVIATSFVSEQVQFLSVYLYKISNHLYSRESNTMPAPLDSEVIERVATFWALEGHPLDSEKPSRRSLYDRYKRKVANELSWGAFSDIVKKLEFRAPPDPFRIAQWKPWVNSEESPADAVCLLRINAVMRLESGRDLYDLEAKWGRRLRLALAGVHPFGQCRFVMYYTWREIAAYYRRMEMYTDDLDTLLTYQVWRPENREVYRKALEAGIAPYPNIYLFSNEDDKPSEWPEEWTHEFKTSWEQQLDWMFTPWGTHIPGIEDDPEKARILDRLLELWAGLRDEGGKVRH
jgi:hypothetical protein